MHGKRPVGQNLETKLKRSKKKYNVPVIGYFADKNVRFNSIIEAEKYTGINYNLIFEACVGKLRATRGVMWEFEKGIHYIKYKAYYLNMAEIAGGNDAEH